MKRPNPQQAIAASAKAALKLTAGMKVAVVNDFGTTVITNTESAPWQLGHGAWVIKLAGFSHGGYDCARVSPVESGVAA